MSSPPHVCEFGSSSCTTSAVRYVCTTRGNCLPVRQRRGAVVATEAPSGKKGAPRCPLPFVPQVTRIRLPSNSLLKGRVCHRHDRISSGSDVSLESLKCGIVQQGLPGTHGRRARTVRKVSERLNGNSLQGRIGISPPTLASMADRSNEP